MSLSLPIFNPNAGRFGTLLESLPSVGQAASLTTISPGRQAACPTNPLPMTMAEARLRGWDDLDIVFITGDAYIDHPSFAMAILGRVLEAAGFRVGIVSQPAWRSSPAASKLHCADWPTTITGPTRSAARFCSIAKPIFWFSEWVKKPFLKSPSGFPRANP